MSRTLCLRSPFPAELLAALLFYSGDDDCAADDDDDVDIECVVFVCIAAWSRAILFRGIRRSPVSRCSVGCHEQEELHGTGKWNLTPFIAAVS